MVDHKDRVRFGAYWLLRRLAKGGMAEIYLACPAQPGREHERLTIKKLLEQYSHEEEFLTLFLQEAKLASQLSHPNVVRIFELGQEGGHLFMAMEYIDGYDLELLIRARRRWLSPVVAAFVAREVCEALSYAHQATDLNGQPLGIVHRDVTPENVMIDRQGVVKLVDFGVARASSRLTTTRPGVVRGKVSHMAPEHIKGKDLDGRADLFALGATLYELTTGIKPFERGQHAPSMWAVLHESPPPPTEVQPDYPPALSDIVMRAVEKDPERRFRSASDMRAALDRYLASTGEEVTSSTLAALVAAQPAEFARDHFGESSAPGQEGLDDEDGRQPRRQIGSSRQPEEEGPLKTQIGAAPLLDDDEPPIKTQIGTPLLPRSPGRPAYLDEDPDIGEPPTQTSPGTWGLKPSPALVPFAEPPRPAPPAPFVPLPEPARPAPPMLHPVEEPRPGPPVLFPAVERPAPPVPAFGDALEEEDTTASGAKPGRRGILEEDDHNPATIRLKPLAEQESERRMAQAVALAFSEEPAPLDVPDDADLALQREETRLTAVPEVGATRVMSTAPSLGDGETRVTTVPVAEPGRAATQPPRRRRHPTSDSAWDEPTPPRGIAAARAEADAADAADEQERKSAAGTVFGGLFKGLLIVSLMAAAGVATRVVTVLEYRQKLADQAEQFEQQILQLQEQIKKAPPPALPSTLALVAGTGDAGTLADGDGGAGPAVDGGPGTPDGGTEEAPADAGGAVDAAAPGPDAGMVFKKGFGVISIKGRGRVFIDDKPCRLPCAVRLPSGEHVVRTGGRRPVEKRVPLQAGAKETLRFP